METIEIRQAEMSDINSLLKLRWEACVEQGLADAQNEVLRRKYERSFREFLEQNLEQPQCQFWLALTGQNIIATATLWLFPILPWPGNVNEWYGYVSNLYTIPAYRHLGVATQMMETLRQVGEQNKVTTLLLQPGPEKPDLYERLGYKPADYVKLNL